MAGVLVSSACADDGQVYTKVDEAPVPVKTPPPVVPSEFKKPGASGMVLVVVVIDETGAVATAEVAKASNDELREPSLNAVKGWRFKPAKLEGKNVRVRLTIPIRYSADV